MKILRYIAALLLLFIVLIAILHAKKSSAPVKPLLVLNSKVKELALRMEAEGFHLDSRTKTVSCKVNGALPDSACTPGAVFSNATSADICMPGYSQSARNVSTKTKRQIYEMYGFAYPQPTGSFEADHLIPLELGGSNDVANLFPEAATPVPGFREKTSSKIICMMRCARET